MRVYPGTTVDYEFAELGTLGYTGTLNDRQFAALRAEGLTGALPDMFGQFDGTLGGGAPDYEAEVQALLAGTLGFVTDPADTAINFTDTAGTVPVTNAGVSTVARSDSKFGTTLYNWQQPTGASQPLWAGASLQTDGIDDHLTSAASYSFASSLTGETITFRVRADALAAASNPLSISHSSATLSRRLFTINTDGSIQLASRRANGDSPLTLISAAGVLSTGVAATIQSRINFTTDVAELFVNGTLVASGTQTGTSGAASDATTTARVRIAANLATTAGAFLQGRVGCIVYAPFVADATQMANCRGFVERNAL